MVNGDGPSEALLEFIKKNEGKAPPSWEGIRNL